MDDIDESIEEEMDRRIRRGFNETNAQIRADLDTGATLDRITSTPESHRSRRWIYGATTALVAASVLGLLFWPRGEQVRAVVDPAGGGATQHSTMTIPDSTSTSTTGPELIVPSPTPTTPPVPTTTVYEASPEPNFDPNLSLAIGAEVPPERLFSPVVVQSDTGPSGSGCTVGGATLPDGTWFGYLGVDAEDRLTLDVACHYDGVAAAAQIEAREGRIADDWEERYVVNSSTRTRMLKTDPDTTIVDLVDSRATTLIWERSSRQRLLDKVRNPPAWTPDRLMVWVFVDQGRVTWLQGAGDNYFG